MFGYITINKPELKIREFELYRSYYCGLCRKINEEYGAFGRIGLSYDMVFLQILLTELYEPQNLETRQGCIFHPFEKRGVLQNALTEYVADMNVLLMYHKCGDDWVDDRKMSRAVLRRMLEKGRKKIKRKYGQKVDEIEAALSELNRREAEGSEDIDEMSGLSGRMLGSVFSYEEGVWQEELYRIGFYLGKFIYLIDAYEDIEQDISKGSYNPFKGIYEEERFEEYCRQILNLTMAECCKVFELLPIVENADILRNILYSGVWNRYEKTRQTRAAERAGRHDGSI